MQRRIGGIIYPADTLAPERLFRVLPARPSLKTDLCYAEVVVLPQVPVARIIIGGAAALLIDRDCHLGRPDVWRQLRRPFKTRARQRARGLPVSAGHLAPNNQSYAFFNFDRESIDLIACNF